MARGIRTVNVQRPKRCDKHGDEDEDNSSKNLNNVHYIPHRKMYLFLFDP